MSCIDPATIAQLPQSYLSRCIEPLVQLHIDKCKDVATTIHDFELANSKEAVLPDAGWRDSLPTRMQSFTPENLRDRVQYIMCFVAIDFSHWARAADGTVDSWTSRDGHRGSKAMTALARLAVDELGLPWYDVDFILRELADRSSAARRIFVEKFEDMPLIEQRCDILVGVARALRAQGFNSFYDLVVASNQRAFGTTSSMGLVELLHALHERYHDGYTVQGDGEVMFWVPVLKLAQLSVIAVQGVTSPDEALHHFHDANSITLCADYQIPRSLRALGAIQYAPALSRTVHERRDIAAGSPEEIGIRCLAVCAGREVQAAYAAAYGCPLPTSRMDYALWYLARESRLGGLEPHHVTPTIMY